MKITFSTLIIAAILLGPIFASEGAPIGKPMPDVSLVNFDGKKETLADLKGNAKILVVGFYSKNCPFNVKRWDRLAALAKEFQGKSVAFVGINPNPQETLASVIDAAKKHGIDYPIVRDEGKGLVKALDAKATPHIYVFDEKGILRYAGAFDDSADADKVKEQFAKNAIEAVLDGKQVANAEPKAFIGCSIKD